MIAALNPVSYNPLLSHDNLVHFKFEGLPLSVKMLVVTFELFQMADLDANRTILFRHLDVLMRGINKALNYNTCETI